MGSTGLSHLQAILQAIHLKHHHDFLTIQCPWRISEVISYDCTFAQNNRLSSVSSAWMSWC